MVNKRCITNNDAYIYRNVLLLVGFDDIILRKEVV